LWDDFSLVLAVVRLQRPGLPTLQNGCGFVPDPSLLGALLLQKDVLAA
jgi:hypothetical protein